MNEVLTNFFDCIHTNPLTFGKTLFPHHFRIPSPAFHCDIMEAVLNNQNLVVGAPRESSKTTVLGFLYPTHQIAFKEKRFIVIITSVFTKSCGILDTIKNEIKNNQVFNKYFPGFTIPRDAEGDSIIAHSDGFQTRILCKGRDQVGTIRGEKFGAYRPDLIIIDDIEDDEMVKNPERRQELRDLIDQVVMFAGERGKTKVVVIGTVLHDDSQLAKMLAPDQYPEFKKMIYRGRNTKDDGEKFSLWKDRWSVADLDKMEAQDPVSFAKEIQNDPVSGLRAQFNRADFRFWRVENDQYVLLGNDGTIAGKGDFTTCRAAIACDLAWEEKRESDYSVILPAFLTSYSELLVDSYICKKGMRPNEIEEILFSMEERLRKLTNSSVYIGFEKAKLEKVMKWLLSGAMKRRNHFLLFKDLQWDADKVQRIVTRLQPRYAQHVIYHRSGMGELEHQLLRVPSGTHDDLPDALQGVVQLLTYPRHFSKPEKEDDVFEWWRQKAIEQKNPTKKRYIFGCKGKHLGIPAQEAYR